VSVVLPTYNRGRTLRRAIDSILNQSYSNLEVLVVDDGSTDDTALVMAGIADPRVHYYPLERNLGASRARNAGLALAKGEFIAFQDSDDEWLAGKLERQVAAAVAAGGGPTTVFHTKILYGKDGNANYGPHLVCCLPIIKDAVPDFRRLVQEINIISPQALLINRAALEKVGPFDVLLVNNNDWAFAIDLVYNTNVVFIDEPLVMTYLQHDSISTFKRSGARSQLRIMQKLRGYPDVTPAVMGAHLGRIGWGITKLGSPRRARQLIIRALRLHPMNCKNWARLAVTQLRIGLGMNKRRSAVVLG
jgi:glycosyltransferase involved in cell wall biosynthesis